MLQFKKFFKVHFNTKKISDDKMKEFAIDHINRIISNNATHEYDAMLEDTVEDYDGYFGAITDEDTSQRLQVARTQKVDRILEDFKRTVREKEVDISYHFGRNSDVYMEFFNRGLTEYTTATKSTVETLMANMIEVGTKYVGVLGQGFVDVFTQLAADYHQARDLQLQQKGIVASEKTATEKNRDKLEIRLSRNLLIIAEKFLGDPSRGLDFFNESLVRDASADGSEDNPPEEDKNTIVLKTKVETEITAEIGTGGENGASVFISDGRGTVVTRTFHGNSVDFEQFIYNVAGTYKMSVYGEGVKKLRELHSNNSGLIDVIISDDASGLENLILQNNGFSTSVTDKILIKMNSFNTGGSVRVINLIGNGAPSAAGLAAKAELESRGWLVLTN